MNSPYNPPGTPTGGVIDAAARQADELLDGADRAAHRSLDALADRAGQVREFAHAAEDQVRHSAHALGERAQHAREAGAGYVREHPLQTVLIAAGVGAALALLTRMLTVRGGAAD
jgi:ElaB/YqjD/DUF883 family membrane-anchored ribosome-binding protein